MKTMMKGCLGAMLIVMLAVGLSFAHCQIPCGIYDDEARIGDIREHITTIERSMDQIRALQKNIKAADAHDYNQMIRWVSNKEDHAAKLQEIASQYFMTQRIAEDDDKYAEKIELLHQMLVYAMKCKQTVDMDYVKKLRKVVDEFEALYFEKSE
ncbi:MAG: superoxide dismutase [Ni] [Thermodesulfobacteriota bacterium]